MAPPRCRPRSVRPPATTTIYPALGYRAVGGGLVFIAGQLPIDAAGQRLTDKPFEAQARQVLANVKAALEAAGSEVSQLLHVRVYLTDIAHWGSFNALYAEWAGAHRPARAVVPVPALHHGLLLEVEAVALAGRANPSP